MADAKNRYSIILPVRNGGEYIKECITSILSQTIPDFDLLILVHDSNDGTLEWVQSVGDSRIKLFPSKHSLVITENWGRIRSIPKNEFMTVIGYDDLLKPDYLAIMQELIQQHPKASLYQTHFEYIDKNGKFIRNCLPMDEIQFGHEFLASHMTRTLDSMGSGYMMRSADYDRICGIPLHYPNLIYADYELWTRLTLISYKATSQKSGFLYRVHQSVSRTTSAVQYQDAFLKYVDFIADLTKTIPQVKGVVEKYGNSLLLYYCQSLSHRLLKTPKQHRSTKVKDFIEKCNEAAKKLGLEEKFKPRKVFKIEIARMIDNNAWSRFLFQTYKRIQ
ncbi:MAG TPA: glycosyltransferase [Chitinophagaceae bacterium]|nr:glycosyltransferase [Chitinophagaceae bacterium]